MQVAGMLWGAKLPNHVGDSPSEVLVSEATGEQTKDLIDRRQDCQLSGVDVFDGSWPC